MMISFDQPELIYLIDFGLCYKYRDSSGNIIDSKDKVGLIGTSRYMSCNSHFYRQQGRNDDLESLGYVLVYLFKGTLPWMHIGEINTKLKVEEVKNIKVSNNINELCEDMPR